MRKEEKQRNERLTRVFLNSKSRETNKGKKIVGDKAEPGDKNFFKRLTKIDKNQEQFTKFIKYEKPISYFANIR